MDDGGRISADNQRVGVAGNLTIDADQIQVTREGALLAAATDGNLGNIVIQSQDLFLDQGGQISTDATLNATGGNISINTGTLVAFDNSDITANAVDNFGGRVIINAQGVFGTAFRSGLTPDSDITATSNLGASFGGLVSISTPDLDTSSGLVVLPTNTVDPNMLMVDTCSGSNQTSSFTVTSTDSLNKNPLDRRLLRFPMLAVVQQLGANSDASETRSNAAILPANEINIAVLNEAIAWKQVGQETVLMGTPTHQVAVNCEVLAQQL